MTRNRLAVGGRSLDLRTPAAATRTSSCRCTGRTRGTTRPSPSPPPRCSSTAPSRRRWCGPPSARRRCPGRFEIVGRSPLVVLDGAHNPAGARAAAVTLGDFHTGGGVVLVVGMSGERDPIEMLEALGALARPGWWWRPRPPRPGPCRSRWWPPWPARSGARSRWWPMSPRPFGGASRSAAPEDVVFVTGSLYVVGTALGRSAPHVVAAQKVRGSGAAAAAARRGRPAGGRRAWPRASPPVPGGRARARRSGPDPCGPPSARARTWATGRGAPDRRQRGRGARRPGVGAGPGRTAGHRHPGSPGSRGSRSSRVASSTAQLSSESWVHDRRFRLSEPTIAHTSSTTQTLAWM